MASATQSRSRTRPRKPVRLLVSSPPLSPHRRLLRLPLLSGRLSSRVEGEGEAACLLLLQPQQQRCDAAQSEKMQRHRLRTPHLLPPWLMLRHRAAGLHCTHPAALGLLLQAPLCPPPLPLSAPEEAAALLPPPLRQPLGDKLPPPHRLPPHRLRPVRLLRHPRPRLRAPLRLQTEVQGVAVFQSLLLPLPLQCGVTQGPRMVRHSAPLRHLHQPGRAKRRR